MWGRVREGLGWKGVQGVGRAPFGRAGGSLRGWPAGACGCVEEVCVRGDQGCVDGGQGV